MPLDHVRWQFQSPRPNALWLAEFAYVAAWRGSVYVASVTDAFARRIVGWPVPRSTETGFILDALEQALHGRCLIHGSGLIHHGDHGSQYVSVRCTGRLAGAGLEPSAGSVGNSDDNALAEIINGLFKAEVVHRREPWRSVEAAELVTLEWIVCFNNRCLLASIDNILPAEAEARCYGQPNGLPMAA